MTDIVTLILSFYFLIIGAARGFVRSLLVPFTIIIGTFVSFVYYQSTKRIIVSLVIGVIFPFLLHLLLKFLLKQWAKATNTEIKPGFLSRLAGAILTFAWGWVFIIFTLVLLAVLPPWGETMTAIHNDVTKSASYFLARPLGETFFSASKQGASVTAKDSSIDDTKSLAEDPRFQATLHDPEIQKEIDAHDMVKLMSNPKMIALTQQIMNDPATMKKVLAIYSSQVKPQDNKNQFDILK